VERGVYDDQHYKTTTEPHEWKEEERKRGKQLNDVDPGHFG
jgi:hypothetical protein